MRCLVSAGPTSEPLDRVRVLSNVSTGRLGTRLAEVLAGHGWEVVLLRSERATHPVPPSLRVPVQPFLGVDDLCARFLEHATGDPVAVFHAAAVSDFAFGLVYGWGSEGVGAPVTGGKLRTREGSVLAELRPTPKILPWLREWYPAGWLAGWKYEVEGGREDVVQLARAQLIECRTQVCVANGPAWGTGFGLVDPGGGIETADDLEGLCSRLAGRVANWRDRQLDARTG